MNCAEFLNLLDAYLDGAASEQDARRLEEHAKECPECAMLLETCRAARLSGGDMQPPPEFSAAWRAGIRKEERMEEKRQKKKQWKNWVAVAAAVVFAAGGTLLTREPLRRAAEAGMETNTAADDMAMELGTFTAGGAMSNFAFEAPKAAARVIADEPMEAEAEETAAGQKIIRTASFTLKTTAFAETMEKLQNLTEEFGGRVESLSQNGDAAAGEMRTASLTLRIPAERLDDFLTGAEDVGRVSSMTEERQDVSENYYDLETRLQTQQAKMERLQALMAQAETVSELIELENAIAETQYNLDSYNGSLQNYDSRIEYSAVRVSVREIAVSESEEVSLGRRMLAGLQSSLEAGGRFLLDALVFLMAALPWIIVVGVVALVTVRVRKKKKEKRKEEK